MADPNSRNPSIPTDPGVLLGQAGRALSEVPYEEARQGCAAELGRLGPELDLTHIDIWRFYRPSDRAEQICAWSVDGDAVAESRWSDATVNERIERALSVGGGTATVPRGWIEDHAEIRLGGEASQVIVSVIDEEDGPDDGSTETTMLIAVPTARASHTLLSSFISDLTVLLKQYNRRVRTQRRFAHLLKVERAIGTASLMISESGSAAEREAFDVVREALGAGALMLSRWYGGRDVEITAASAPGLPIDPPMRFDIPDVPGVDVEAAIAGRFGQRQISQTDGLISAALGPEAERGFGEFGARRSVAMVPAGTTGRMALGAVRHADQPWDPSELDALTSFGAVVGQARERAAALGVVESRDALDRRLVELGHQLDGSQPDAAAATLRTALPELGRLADLTSVSVSWMGESALPAFDWTADSGAADTDAAATAITADVGDLGVLDASWPPEQPAPAGLRAIADLFGRIEARARAGREAAFEAAAAAVFSRTAEALTHLRPTGMIESLARCLEDVGHTLELSGVVLRGCDHAHEHYTVLAAWLPDETLRPRASIPYGENERLDRARVDRVVIDTPAGEGMPARLILPVGIHARVDHLLIAGVSVDDPRFEFKRNVLSRCASLVSQAVGRVEAERYAGMAFANSLVGIAVSDARGVALAVNDALVGLAGADRADDLIGTRFIDHLADPNDVVEWVEDGDVRRARMRLRRPDGTWWLGQFEIRPVLGSEEWLVHITDVTTRERAETELRHAATHDSLTALPNRRALNEALAAIPDGDQAALLLLDLDRFKNVNDSLGHEFGDDLLVTVADRLRFSVRPGDLVARLGGDEFGVLLAAPTDAVYAGQTADRIMRVLSDPITIGGHRAYPSVSIGISLAAGGGPEGYLREADIAMYQAKDAGGARYTIFDADLQRTVDERHHIETGLRAAIAEGQIEAWYQPEVDLRSGAVLSAEALVRWRHPERGVVAAAEFIQVAEQSGLIQDIGLRVLDLACAEAATWPGGIDAPTVRVNLSADQLHRDDLVETITRTLATHGLAARRLCLEITESAAMRDVDRSEEALHALRDLGVELAIDDFGTGYSSLAYLKRFPFQTLKIDRSFVSDVERDPEDRAFVGSIISLAESLGLAVVAEGIENAAQADVLVELGCHRGQGYHFAKPAPADELRARIG